jgi:hypothetical protein
VGLIPNLPFSLKAKTAMLFFQWQKKLGLIIEPEAQA